MSSTPVHLDQCERLNAEAYSECTRFSRFVLLQPKASGSSKAGDGGPARLPVDFKFRDKRRIAALVAEARARLQNLKMRLPVVDPPKVRNPPKGIDQAVAGLGVVKVRGRLDKVRRVEEPLPRGHRAARGRPHSRGANRTAAECRPAA
jgi:hypothetical protein